MAGAESTESNHTESDFIGFVTAQRQQSKHKSVISVTTCDAKPIVIWLSGGAESRLNATGKYLKNSSDLITKFANRCSKPNFGNIIMVKNSNSATFHSFTSCRRATNELSIRDHVRLKRIKNRRQRHQRPPSNRPKQIIQSTRTITDTRAQSSIRLCIVSRPKPI